MEELPPPLSVGEENQDFDITVGLVEEEGLRVDEGKGEGAGGGECGSMPHRRTAYIATGRPVKWAISPLQYGVAPRVGFSRLDVHIEVATPERSCPLAPPSRLTKSLASMLEVA